MFNLFFTTKPAGEGTGLGLSITHDIIVKQHSGSIEGDTQPASLPRCELSYRVRRHCLGEIKRDSMNLLVLVVDDEPDIEALFRQHFRRDLRAGRFIMEFAQSAPATLRRITDATGVQLILVLSDSVPGCRNNW
jgi:signal transduction histidine kinase